MIGETRAIAFLGYLDYVTVIVFNSPRIVVSCTSASCYYLFAERNLSYSTTVTHDNFQLPSISNRSSRAFEAD